MKEISDELKALDEVKGESKHINFGFPELEDALRVHREGGQLIILASRPAMGKSALALNMASAFAENEGKPVALYSLEMLSKEITLRLLAQRGKVEANSIRDSKLLDGDLSKIGKCISDLSQLPIFINDDGDIDLDKLKVSSLEVKDQNGLGLIVIDYLQLLNSTERNLPREQQISEMMRGLKSLAKELEVPIIVLSQLNRGVESRKDKRPQLSDLRESGSIESDADIVMFLYRDGYYNDDCIYPDDAEVIIAKNRSGQTGTINLDWDSKYTNFMPSEKVKKELIEDSIVSSHTFDNLEVGEFNKSSIRIAKQIAEKPSGFSTVYISSEVGEGKSYTLHAIYNKLKNNFPEKNICLTSARNFTADFILSIQDRSLSDFKNSIRKIDVLLIDDIDEISGKTATQKEISDLLSDMKSLGKQIILTGKQPLRRLDGIEDKLSSRISESLFINIGNPDAKFKKILLIKSCMNRGSGDLFMGFDKPVGKELFTERERDSFFKWLEKQEGEVTDEGDGTVPFNYSELDQLSVEELSIREIIAVSEKVSIVKSLEGDGESEDIIKVLERTIKEVLG